MLWPRSGACTLKDYQGTSVGSCAVTGAFIRMLLKIEHDAKCGEALSSC